MYSVKELLENINQKVSDLGLSPVIKLNPAYKTALAHIIVLISQIGMKDKTDTIEVLEKDNIISFEFNKNMNEKYTIRISVPYKDTLRCERAIEKKEIINGDEVKTKTVDEVISKIDDMGNLVITSNYGEANNLHCDRDMCNIIYGAERKVYNNFGIMEKREIRRFPKYGTNKNIEEVSNMFILSGARDCFNTKGYSTRTLLVREKIDVAKVVYENNRTMENYIGMRLLNGKNGYADMSISSRNLFDNHVIIRPLMIQEIEKMIDEETDPKVRIGLREYAKDREFYSYDSDEDVNYHSNAMK